MTERTKLYLNTWGAYNNGCIGYGWMTAEKAREFIENNPGRDGGEWFIADIENYLGVNIDYYAKINFKGLVKLVNAVDGVEINVQQKLCTDDSNRGGEVCIKPGI